MSFFRSFLIGIWIACLAAGCQVNLSIPATIPVTGPAATPPPIRTPLSVFAAGSLIIPFDELEEAFEARYPQVDVRAEYHGSIQVMRHVTDLHEPIDVVATADASLIPMLMYAAMDEQTGRPYADWYIQFASNRLALAYHPGSLGASEINAENWPSVLARPEVKFGLADPRFDASGYRALMAVALAEERAGSYTTFGPLFDGQFSSPIAIFRDDLLTTITVPEILETVSGAHLLLRGASIQLIALLESGDLDYAFEYESVIQQHGLQMVPLPDEVNLGAEGYDETYRRVQVNLDFQRFATVKPEFRGERIGYGITIPTGAPHPDEASLFIAYLLGEEGRAIMDSNYQPVFTLPILDGEDNLPPNLKELLNTEATP